MKLSLQTKAENLWQMLNALRLIYGDQMTDYIKTEVNLCLKENRPSHKPLYHEPTIEGTERTTDITE